MNPAITTSLLKTENVLDNNMLSANTEADSALTNELFNSEFSGLLENILSADGKFKPLDLAALKESGTLKLDDLQKLAELQELGTIALSSEALDFKQPPVLNLLSNEIETSIENVELFGNPEVGAMLKSDLISNDSADEIVLNGKNLNEANLLKGKEIVSDSLQHSVLKKEADLSDALKNINLSQYVKDMDKTDIDFGRDLLTQAGRQDTNISKLVEQISSSEKTLNPISPLNSQSLKSYSGIEQSTTVAKGIDVPVNQAGWGEEVGNRLMMMVNGKVQSANIHLNPAELGPIEIKISVKHDQTTVHFVSNNSIVRDAIEDAFPRLKEMFTQNGLSLSDANVSQQSSQQSSQFYNDQNESMAMSNNNDSLETTDITSQDVRNNMMDIGLVNHYV